MAQPPSGGTILLWPRESGVVASLPHSFHTACVPAGRLAGLSRGQSDFCERSARRSRRISNVCVHSGFSLRAAAADAERTQRERDRRSVLAYTMAQSCSPARVPVEGGIA